ncbi:hypothetical protein EUTSA_v10023797mg [Eutrema salsugineum]|uniref:Uncharacterized protein n=1 Tax=Eutrema salsugineum TaxID=72664 RepID=V4ME92_EUTSA|nr:hypothetical protein EUTSA_v10023797mg [Eutrema salsugineum]
MRTRSGEAFSNTASNPLVFFKGVLGDDCSGSVEFRCGGLGWKLELLETHE